MLRILSKVADAVGDYVGYQIDAGAQCVQIFDSWGGQLPSHMWEEWSKPYIQQVVDKVRATHPGVPLTLYANGSGGLLERMATTGVDCIGLDWTIDMEDGRRRVGDKAVQGNVDPPCSSRRRRLWNTRCVVCRKAGPTDTSSTSATASSSAPRRRTSRSSSTPPRRSSTTCEDEGWGDVCVTVTV